jgi:hypothetical protein
MSTTDKNTTLNFTLVIPFANASARNRAKQAGATWDATSKVWKVTTSIYKIDNLRNLAEYVVETNMSATEIELWRNR